MSRSSYTNRHGKTVQIDQDTGREVVVANAPQPVIQTQTIPMGGASEGIKAPRKKRSFGRVARIAVVALVLLIVAVLVYNQSAVSDYNQASDRMKTNVKQASSLQIKTEVDLAQTISKLNGALPEVTCSSPLPWIEFLPAIRDAKNACQSTSSHYQALRASLGRLNSVATYSAQLSSAMGDTLKAPAGGSFAEINTYRDKWKAAIKNAQAIQAPSLVKNGHTATIEAMKAVEVSWSKLADANASQDSTAYDAAKNELSKSYDNLRTATDKILADVLPLQKQISEQSASIR